METQLSDSMHQMFTELHIYPSSVTQHRELTYALGEPKLGTRRLVILAPSASTALEQFTGEASVVGDETLLIGPLEHHNATALRSQLSWLNPVTLGLRTSAGLGDRLGIATPGHLRAVREAGGHIAPIPAQQSIREMIRTGRSPQQVFDDAMWGVFTEGWRAGFAADADHLKSTEDIDRCMAAGYTFYTFDPGEHVDHTADTAPRAVLQDKFEALPWTALEDSSSELLARYHVAQDFEGHVLQFDGETLMRASVKYGRALAHVARLYRHLASVATGHAWEVEISVDETETPTTHAEHVYFVTELRRLGVQWVSLAPRYVGRFEKGVDYIGDLDGFTADFALHAAIARTLGPYKLSLHSGSDKFSIYEIAARETQGLVHLKTAGTSYLEALRTVAQVQPDLLRDIYAFALERYETDRASYHVSAELKRAPVATGLADNAVPALLDQFDARQVLHVTFGSVLTAQDATGSRYFYGRMMEVLNAHPGAYAVNLTAHFLRHLRPFAAYSKEATE
ncbi:MAG TPA: tagaturonate epimerase family protein [Ktedonobacterales bacterium]|nr:tagaturonate epimerase family protein [Ktedonobacterales bacterium]